MTPASNVLHSIAEALHLAGPLPKLTLHDENDMTLVLTQGNIWTGVDAPSGGTVMAEAFAYSRSSGRIGRVGSCDDLLAELGDTQCTIIDMRPCGDNCMVVPGFHDNHVHLNVGGHLMQGLDLEGVSTRALFAAKLAMYYSTWLITRHHHERVDLEEDKNEGDDDWIIGGSMSQEKLGRSLDKSLIDAVVANTPVMIFASDLHSALVNGEALKRAGIDKDTVQPEGGTIELDEVTGEPTGMLRDEAIGLVQRLIPHHHALSALYHAVDHMSSLGVTSVAHMGAGPNAYKIHGTWDELRAFEKSDRKKNHHSVRVHSVVELDTYRDLKQKMDALPQGSDGSISPYLKIGLLKAFADGAQGSATALEYEHYKGGSTNPEEREYPHGKRVVELEELRTQAKQAIVCGFSLAIHCIGDHACHDVIKLFEEIVSEHEGIQPHRLRIEHATHLRPEDLERLVRLKDSVSVCVNPQHLGSSVQEFEGLLRPKDRGQMRNIYRIRSLIDRGLLVSFGSDWPIASASPLVAIYDAVMRLPDNSKEPFLPQECVTVDQALRCVTINAARMNGTSEYLGLLQEGYAADFTILDRNLLRIPFEQIKKTQVLLTCVNGDIKHDNTNKVF